VAGLGFTVPLLIAGQAFAGHRTLIDASELGLLAGSALGFVVGAVILVVAARRGPGQPAFDRGDDRKPFIPW
jgi:Na+:H+ antiporter, NhaA family